MQRPNNPPITVDELDERTLPFVQLAMTQPHYSQQTHYLIIKFNPLI